MELRSQVRRGLLRPEPPSALVPVQLLGEPPDAEPAKYAKPSRAAGPDVAPPSGVRVWWPRADRMGDQAGRSSDFARIGT